MTWQSKLVRWYRAHRRDLPWRRNPTPYRVLVSEIMLQQTTVKTVIPYYRRFLKQFPSLRALATARQEAVLSTWSGLGYYSRARNLHKTAKICTKEDGGRVPSDLERLKKLPGIGAYTAGAIASIAFDQTAPIVDGNVARVLARLYCMKADPKNSSGAKTFWAKAATILPKKSCGDFNQALMELGATVCTPTQPACPVCPLQKDCESFMMSDPMKFPRIKKKITYRNVALTAALIANNNSFLMIRRPSQGVLRDMWEFPMIEGDLADLEAAYLLNLAKAQRLKPVGHSIMDQRIKITPWLFSSQQFDPKPQKSRWLTLNAIRKLPTSSMVPKLLAQLPLIRYPQKNIF